MSSFETLAIHPRVLKALTELGFDTPTDVQQQAIPAGLERKDLLVSAVTGSGKTAAFLVPMLSLFVTYPAPNSNTRALIVVPTRELALQIQSACDKFASFTTVKSGLLIGGEAFKFQISTLRKNPEIIVATPGRLVEHIEKGHIGLNDLEVLVLDEADRMLDMGFAEDLHTIVSATRKERCTWLFSATLRRKGMDALLQQMSDPVRIHLSDGKQGHSHIQQDIVLIDDVSHKQKVLLALIAQPDIGKTFVFCRTRLQCQQVSNLIEAQKIKSAYLHGEMAQSDRKQILNRFRDNKLQVLVTTDIAARGLDVKDIDTVINYDIAGSGDEHTHRVGRTGRAGQRGVAITLVGANEWNLMSSIERYLKIQFNRRELPGLKAVYTGPKKLKKSGKAASSKKRAGSKKPASKKKPVKKPKRTYQPPQ